MILIFFFSFFELLIKTHVSEKSGIAGYTYPKYDRILIGKI